MPYEERRTGRTEIGYCFNCLRINGLREVVTFYRGEDTGSVGWECPSCGGVSSKPHKTCPKFGASCRVHEPIEPAKEAGTGYTCIL
ncbi:MAG: hypothetical protein GF334_10280 [Candidatus Altiarchaeales archaeon]|nr:hypothetical protein [Candidatus Altiarchaeales archaeon]